MIITLKNMTLLKYFAIVLLLICGCETTTLNEVNRDIYRDDSLVLVRGNYSSFQIQGMREMKIEMTSMQAGMGFGMPAYSGQQEYFTTRVIENVIKERFESIGLIHDQDNGEVVVFYDPMFQTAAIDENFADTTAAMRILAKDKSNDGMVFAVALQIKSQRVADPVLLGNLTGQTLDMLKVFQQAKVSDIDR